MIICLLRQGAVNLIIQVHHIAPRLWPHPFDTPSAQIGAFIARFEFADDEPSKRDILSTSYTGDVEIIPLEEEVIARRVVV
jgi:hypothetical protein